MLFSILAAGAGVARMLARHGYNTVLFLFTGFHFVGIHMHSYI